jgi:branched-chain amino acid transport system ATP-binding protein
VSFARRGRPPAAAAGVAPSDDGECVVDLEHLSVWHGDAQSVFDVSLSIRRDESVGILGRNGAGKTSTLMGIVGAEVRTTGGIRLFGQDCSRLGSDRRVRRGLAWVPDSRRILSRLTVKENLLLAQGYAWDGEGLELDDVLATFPMLTKLLNNDGFALSGGEQQLVSIARALITNPRFVLVDEPTEGLAPVIVAQVHRALADMRARGMPLLIVEQNLGFALALVDRVYVLDRGRVVHEATSAEFAGQEDIHRQYLATSGMRRGGPVPDGSPVPDSEPVPESSKEG